MKRLLTVIAITAVCLWGNTAVAQDLSQFEKREFKAGEEFTLPYRILYPEEFNPDKKYPLVVFLHGAGERGNDNEAQLTHGAKLFLSPANRKAYPAVVIFPQCPANRVWFAHPYLVNLLKNSESEQPVELKAVKGIVDLLVANGYIDTRRIYVTGLSMGGFGTFGMASIWPDLIAAAAPICGGAVIDDIPRYAQQIPFWVFHGGADTTVKPELSRQAVDALKAAKGKVMYTEYEGVGHNSWDNVFAEPKYLKWMFGQKKKPAKE